MVGYVRDYRVKTTLGWMEAKKSELMSISHYNLHHLCPTWEMYNEARTSRNRSDDAKHPSQFEIVITASHRG